VPYLKKSANPHILTLSPPLTMRADWFAQNLPYTLSKYGMSMVIVGHGGEFKTDGIACNSLWPRTIYRDGGGRVRAGAVKSCSSNRDRRQLMADAAYAILNEPARKYTGQFLSMTKC